LRAKRHDGSACKFFEVARTKQEIARMSAQENQISLDGPIRRVLAAGMPSAEPCPSADVFAAYYEHSLDPEETEHYDKHFASCASCRAILAGVARASVATIPALETKQGSQWWNSMRVWLATAAACVAVLLVAVVFIQRSSKSTGTENAQLAMSRAVATPAPAESLSHAATTPAPAPPENVPPMLAGNAPAMPLPKSVKTPKPAPPPQDQAVDLSASASASAAVVEPAAPAPAPAERKKAEDARDGAVAALQPSATPQVAPDARQEMSANRAMQAKSAAGFAATMKKPKAQAPAKYIVVTSPGSQITWTIHTNHVQYAENGQPAPVQDFIPTNSAIAAGSSPGGKVCWLVGADGAVVRTTDGRLWLGTNSPTGSDLKAIKATSARAATVTSSDGHTYVTADAGQTWKSATAQN
jgi:hypothetical protein